MATRQEELIEKLVEGQKHAGYQVWNASGIATARIKQNSADIVGAIKGIAPQIIGEGDKDDAEDDAEAELERKRLAEEEEERKRKGGLLGGIGGLLKSLAVGKDGKGEKSLFGKGGIWGIAKSIFGILWKLVKFIGGPLLLLGGIAFMTMDAGQQKKVIEGVTKALNKTWEFIKYLGTAFSTGFMGGMDDVVDPKTNKVLKEGLKSKFKKFQVAWGKAFESIEKIEFGPFTGVGGPYTGLAGIAHFMGDLFSTIIGFMIDVGTGIGNFIADPKRSIANFRASVEAVFEKMGIITSAFFSNLFSLESFSNLIKYIIGDTMYDILMLKGGFFADKMKEVHKRAQSLREAEVATLKRKEKFTKEEADRLDNEMIMKKKNGEQVTMAEEMELARARKAVELYQMQREAIENEIKDARAMAKMEFVRQQVREKGKEKGLEWSSEANQGKGGFVGIEEDERQKSVMDVLLRDQLASTIPEERIRELTKTGMNEELAKDIQAKEKEKGNLGSLSYFTEINKLKEEGDVEGFRKILQQLAVTGSDIATTEDAGLWDTGFFKTEKVMDKASHDQFIEALKILGFSAKKIGEQKAEVDIDLVKRVQAVASRAMFTMNVLQKDQLDLIEDQTAFNDSIGKLTITAREDFEKKFPENKKKYGGGLVDWSGLAWVDGGDDKPELMLDNIQMNRLEALLTMGERDRGGGGSNDFSTQNMDNRRITSTVTNVAAPQRHLFGVQEQRFGIA